MAKKQLNKHELLSGRVTLLFFWLILLWGVLRLERFARYRYDLIIRHWLPWLLPVLFAGATAAFGILLWRWIKGGKKDSGKLFSPSFSLLLPLPLMAAFLFPWLANFATGIQFFRLAAECVFYAGIGGFAAYLGYALVGRSAAIFAGAATLNALSLFYFYDRFLSPSSFILNTDEFGYLPQELVALIMAAVVVAGTLAALLTAKGGKHPLRPLEGLLPAGLTVALLILNALIPFGITPIRWMIFGGIGLNSVWFLTWCLLKKKNFM